MCLLANTTRSIHQNRSSQVSFCFLMSKRMKSLHLWKPSERCRPLCYTSVSNEWVNTMGEIRFFTLPQTNGSARGEGQNRGHSCNGAAHCPFGKHLFNYPAVWPITPFTINQRKHEMNTEWKREWESDKNPEENVIALCFLDIIEFHVSINFILVVSHKWQIWTWMYHCSFIIIIWVVYIYIYFWYILKCFKGVIAYM